MALSQTLSLIANLITIIVVIGGILAVYFKNEKGSDERLVKNEKDINSIRQNIIKMEQDCERCKADLTKRINDVEARSSDRFTDLTNRMTAMEKSLREEIRALGQNIIDILNK